VPDKAKSTQNVAPSGTRFVALWPYVRLVSDGVHVNIKSSPEVRNSCPKGSLASCGLQSESIMNMVAGGSRLVPQLRQRTVTGPFHFRDLRK
jgi:hypothetical protein